MHTVRPTAVIGLHNLGGREPHSEHSIMSPKNKRLVALASRIGARQHFQATFRQLEHLLPEQPDSGASRLAATSNGLTVQSLSFGRQTLGDHFCRRSNASGSVRTYELLATDRAAFPAESCHWMLFVEIRSQKLYQRLSSTSKHSRYFGSALRCRQTNFDVFAFIRLVLFF